MVEILRTAIRNVREFHLQQKDESWEFYAGDGVRLGVRNTAVARVGLYIPGGTASYPFIVLMNAIPAQVAGVERIAVVTPPKALEQKSLIAAALDLLGDRRSVSSGRSALIAALAYGTQSIASSTRSWDPAMLRSSSEAHGVRQCRYRHDRGPSEDRHRHR
jgi:histidinol dehydrogenase